MRLLKTAILLLLPAALLAQHPVTFFTKKEAAEVKSSLNKYPLLTQSYAAIKSEVEPYLGKDVDVPFPKDPAGGYTHDKHKLNYMIMFNAGVLYNLTGDARYAKLVKDMLFKYARLNPTLKNHPEATSSSPGRIFWQALNDANWLVYAGMAYDLIYNSLTKVERKTIEQGAFKPEVDFVTKDLESWFNLIHNHGVWACAGVGIVGLATGNQEYVDMALYGTKKDGKSGFIAQMNGLFSPDGYYTEGPYYVRYAIFPYYIFSNALHNARPGLKIFAHRDSILYKALIAALQQTNLDGTFFPLNDALKEKDYTSYELVNAVNIARKVYGINPGFLPVAKKQGQVLLTAGGVAIASELAAGKNVPEMFPYKTIEYRDGKDGDEGGVSIIRSGKGNDMTSLIFKYSSHGLSHGHFDKLNYNVFDKGNEILTDYGSVRFIGIEQKFGGRYLPENKAYASQTIAHNTIVIDEKNHFEGKESIGEKHHSEKIYSHVNSSTLQVVSAKEENAYPGVKLHRTIYMIELPGGRRIIADIFNTNTAGEHQFDLPFHYDGHIINTSFKYQAYTKKQEALGKKNGYQFLWNEAEARIADTIAQLTILNDRTYYTLSSLVTDSARIILARSGANDPNFNLRHEPAMIIRKNGKSQNFINILEIHGKFDPVREFSSHAYPQVKSIKMLQQDEFYSIAEIRLGDHRMVIAQSNKDFDPATIHKQNNLEWKGPFLVTYDGKSLR